LKGHMPATIVRGLTVELGQRAFERFEPVEGASFEVRCIARSRVAGFIRGECI